MVGTEILLEIDSTLDQLIENAEAIQSANLQELSEMELSAFQKTQESLLHHLLHMDAFLEEKKKSLRIPNEQSARSQIAAKKAKFTRLKNAYQSQVDLAIHHRSDLLSKRKGKRLLPADKKIS